MNLADYPQYQSSVLVVDIETTSDMTQEMLEKRLERIKVPSNYKKEEAKQNYIEREQKKIIEKAACSPLTARVSVVGLAMRKTDGSNGWDYAVFVDRGDNEQGLLDSVDRVISECALGNYITYNGRSFDFPFLTARAMRHRLKLRRPWPQGFDRRHIDLFEVLGKKGSLDEWATVLLGHGKTTASGLIAKLIEEQKWDLVEEHCREDLEITANIYDLWQQATGKEIQ